MSTEQRRNNIHFKGWPLITYLRQMIVALAAASAMAQLTSCGSGPASTHGTGPTPAAVKITTSATLTPAFDPIITDYSFIAQSSKSLNVSVSAPAGTQVSVDGQPARTLSFNQTLSITAGQSFSIVATSGGSSKTYYIHCLPTDFPTWTTSRLGTPQAEFYAITPNAPIVTGEPIRHYLIIVDGYGVPVWWYHSFDEPNNPIVLPNGNIASEISTGAEELTLNGAIVRSFTVNSSIGGTFDPHELLQLSNGDYIIIADVDRGPVNLTAFNGLASAMVIDNVIEEIAPNGSLVWSWSAMDHIPFTETDPIWWPQYIQNLSLADPFHMNSVEPDGDGFVISFRHLDAVIRIDKASGNIVWKLGGTNRPQSLKFKGDKYGNFAGQHDARLLPDGTLTVHDNGTLQGRGPRAVRYDINTTSNTATFVEQVTDPSVSVSGCCGSARKLTGGDWGITWGLNPVVTEMTAAGKEVLRMTFNQPYFTYRALPVPSGMLTVAALRSGMNAQYPR